MKKEKEIVCELNADGVFEDTRELKKNSRKCKDYNKPLKVDRIKKPNKKRQLVRELKEEYLENQIDEFFDGFDEGMTVFNKIGERLGVW